MWKLVFEQKGRYFNDSNFECIFLNENGWITNEISLKCVATGLNWQSVHIGNANSLVPSEVIVCTCVFFLPSSITPNDITRLIS